MAFIPGGTSATSGWKGTVEALNKHKNAISAGLNLIETSQKRDLTALDWAGAAVASFGSAPVAVEGKTNWSGVARNALVATAGALYVGHHMGEDAALDFFGRSVGRSIVADLPAAQRYKGYIDASFNPIAAYAQSSAQDTGKLILREQEAEKQAQQQSAVRLAANRFDAQGNEIMSDAGPGYGPIGPAKPRSKEADAMAEALAEMLGKPAQTAKGQRLQLDDFGNIVGPVDSQGKDLAPVDFRDVITDPAKFDEAMAARRDSIIAAGEKYGIDPRALEAVIQWEYNENLLGRYSDLEQAKADPTTLEGRNVLASDQGNAGLGFGSMHTKFMEEVRPGITLAETKNIRLDLDQSIAFIAEGMGKLRDEFRLNTGGKIDISGDPVMLAWAFNTGFKGVDSSIDIQRARDNTFSNVSFDVRDNDMAVWVSQNLASFGGVRSEMTFGNFVAPFRVNADRSTWSIGERLNHLKDRSLLRDAANSGLGVPDPKTVRKAYDTGDNARKSINETADDLGKRYEDTLRRLDELFK